MSSSNSSSSLNGDGELIAEQWIRMIGALSYGLLATISLAMNSLLALIFIKGRQFFQRTAFYAIAWQLVICDICAQLIQMGIAVPITWTGQMLFGQHFVFYAVLFFDTVAYNGTLYFSALMTLSRLTIFFSDKANQIFFSGIGKFCSIFAIWIFVFAYVIATNLTGCRKSFSETGFYLYHECIPLEQQPPFGQLIRQFSALASTYLPILMLLAYLLLFIHIRRSFRISNEAMMGGPDEKENRPRRMRIMRSMENGRLDGGRRREKTKRQKEFAFLIQSFIICAALEVQDLAFIFIPKFPLSGQFSFFVNFAENWVCILLNTVGPISLFSFNSDVRRILRRIWRGQSEIFFTRTSRF